MTHWTRTTRLATLAAAVMAVTACDGLLDVDSPGRIGDDDLESPDAIPGMVIGMQYDMSQAVDGGLELISMASMELFHGGSYGWNEIPRGTIEDDDSSPWSSAQQARWVAEEGILRMGEILEPDQFARSPYAAEANVWAGYANRFLGEVFCSSVINGGPEIDHAEHFSRAEGYFTDAIALAEAAGRADLEDAAYAGRATVRAWQGNWSGAATDAEQVPIGFTWWAQLDTEMRNEITYETHTRFEYSVWGTIFEDHPDDPRAPWEIEYNADNSVANGANGSTPHYKQLKYTDRADDIPLAKGTEMLILRAEAALREGVSGIPAAYGLMNEARVDGYGMDPLPVAATLAEAWADLHFERLATNWIEGRALWDYRRWSQESGPAQNNELDGRDLCWPIPEWEKDANPNFRG
jgi:starch-binding outer membrane protein, SusD/RagB family